MYERNAVIIERYFGNMFGYNIRNNIKRNFDNYCKLVEAAESYKKCTEEEEEIIIEYDIIANKITDIQKKQENLNKENIKLQDERNNFFENIDEDANIIQKKLDKVNNDIKKIDEEIQENAINFINVVAEFNEKSIIRDKCGKRRRAVEIDYNKKLNETLDNYKNIDLNLEKRAKQFIELDTSEIENELKNEILKNGEKEKIPFQKDVIKCAITLSIDNQKKETDILANIYEKTNKLFSEIKNNNLKLEKHKKIILDSNSKLCFISALKEYVIQFLDNERLAAVNGENEYNKLMKDACKNLKNDLIQINNLYTLLLKEISKKATKKTYTDLYNIEYLKKLEKNAEEFENEVKKLKLPVAVINPNYWRIEGMKKIYSVFNKCVTENYNRDLKEFISAEEDSSDDENTERIEYEEVTENTTIKKQENNSNEKDIDNDTDDAKSDNTDNQNEDKLKSEIDKKIDIILGLNENETNNSQEKLEEEKNIENDEFEDEEIIDDDIWDDEETEEDLEEDKEDDEEEWDEDPEDNEEDWGEDEEDDDDEWEEDQETDEEEWDEDLEYDEEDWDKAPEEDEEEWDEDQETDEEEWDEDTDDNEESDENTEDDEKIDYDIWGNNVTKKPNKVKNKKNIIENKSNKDWGDEFINIEKKDKKKKKGFFEKFKK